MPHDAFFLRFPNGDTDLYSGFRPPSLGDTIEKRRLLWTVVTVADRSGGPLWVSVMPLEASTSDLEAAA